MEAVLCNIPQYSERRSRKRYQWAPFPQIAIISLTQYMEKFGYFSDFYDIDALLPSDDEIFEYFKTKQPDVVGISAVTSVYIQVKRISSIIRRACPSAWIVLGGNMSTSANVLLRKTDVDICVIGHGEKTWVAFLDYVQRFGREKDMEELSKIKGIAFINDQDELEFTGYGKAILGNENPFPDYNLLSKGLLSNSILLENYFHEVKENPLFKDDPRTHDKQRKPKMAMIWTTKGCVNRCTFCQRTSKGYQLFDLKKLDLHLKELKEKYEVGFIQFIDENFGSNRKYSYEVAKILKKHDLIWYAGGVRCTSVTLEDLKFYKECGCTGLKFGVESGSQKILDIMEKNFTIDDVYSALKNAYKCQLNSPPLFCLGMPGETDQTVMETGEYLGNIAKMFGAPPTIKDFFVGVTYAMPFFGTPLYEYGQLQGVIGTSVDEEEELLILMSDMIAGKVNFINLTGMNTKTVLFWDFLVYYEAMRVFYQDPVYSQEYKDLKKVKSSLSLRIRLTRFLYEPITYINEILIGYPLMTKLPRSLVYVPMRNLLYIEYRMHVILKPIIRIFGNRGKKIANLFEFQSNLKPCDPLREAKSLRKINKKLRDALPKPETLTEKNQRILRMGS